MTLKMNGACATDATGQSETLVLSVVQATTEDRDAGATAEIETAFYGTDEAGNPEPVTVSADRRTLTLTTLHGVNPLTVNYVAADGTTGTAQLAQNGTVLAEAELNGHTGTSVLLIEGT
jgi:hypothetical protein